MSFNNVSFGLVFSGTYSVDINVIICSTGSVHSVSVCLCPFNLRFPKNRASFIVFLT